MKPSRKRIPLSSRFSNPLAIKRAIVPRSLSRTSSKIPTKPMEKPAKTRLGRLRQRLRPLFTWKKLLVFSLAAFAVLIISVAGVFAYYVRGLPNPNIIRERATAQSTQILDRNGKSLYNIHGEENRTIVKGDQINDYLKKATIAVEDASFYSHHGFDPKGLSRAVYNKLTGRGIGGGGSTITQQYIKNRSNDREGSLSRKIREIILAIEIEQTYTKDEILTGYLNEIPYGSNAYGIEAASKTYFDKSAKDLTLSEAATLAGIPQQPTTYSPYGNHLESLFTRKDYILDRMVKVGFITQAEADKAKTDGPSLNNPSFKSQKNLIAPHFVFYVREKLIESLGEDKQVAEQKLDEAGYVVVTSLDLDTQQMAQKVLAEMGPDAVKKYKATNAALSAVDPKTGEILAMVGSIDYENSKSGNTNFATALLQPGSSFKPLVYATAFGPTHTYSPASITFDVPTDFGKYKPNNYNGKFNGPVTNRMALAGSLNIPAVKNLYLAGLKESIDTAKSMGITTLNRPLDNYGLSLVLGSGEVKGVEMASAYSTFANGGMHNALRPILRIEKDNKIVKDFTTVAATKALEPEVAYEISNILSDNGARAYIFGTKNNLILPDRPVAAKSGTTENNRDAWTIGYTPQIAVAVWVGNNEDNKTMVKGADGSYVAAPMWNRFMREYLKDKPVTQFERPASIKDVQISKLSGKLPTDQTPEDQKITDIFAPWQVPTKPDDVNVKVKIDKATGKLATDLTPAEYVEERKYFIVHSEVPDNPNWENPVQEWAKANGGGIAPPTEKDDQHTEENRPSITLVSPKNGVVLTDTLVIEPTIVSTRAVTQVEYLLDGASIGKRTEAPWGLTYSIVGIAPGSHTLKATIINDIGLTNSQDITFSTSKDATAPGEVTGVVTTDGAKVVNKPIHLVWTNPADLDLSSVVIYLSSSDSPADLGVQVKGVPSTASSAGSADIDVSNLAVGKNYYLILRAVDSNGNENTSVIKHLVKVLP